VKGSCEHGNEPSDSIEDTEFLDCLSDNQLLKKDSIPSTYLLKRFGIGLFEGTTPAFVLERPRKPTKNYVGLAGLRAKIPSSSSSD
jgi:hypothetical protein